MSLIESIASAIATQEGFWVSGSIPQTFNNPGDLRAAPWLAAPQVVNGYVKFDSPAQGIAGLFHQIALDVARGWTLRQLIEKWAPPIDSNNTEKYLSNVMAWTNLPADQPLQELLEITKLA